MRWHRKKFFDGVKDRIDPTLNQEQVDGFEFLLTSFENDPQWKDVRHCAYGLATVWHETAYSMQPVEEGYYLGSRAKRFQKTLRYYPYFGRGYVQLTHKTNYAKAGSAFGVDLVNNPNMALDPAIAFKCLGGMFKGWYGGKLGTYINASKTDYVNARRCVNILDKAGLIAGYAKSFEKILNSAATSTATDVAANTTTNTATTPATTPLESPPIEIETTVVETEGDTVTATTTTQSETVTIAAPSPYMEVGFWGVIKRDLAAATGGNLSFTALSEYAQQASGWPEWVVGIITKLAIGALIATAGYFIFRVIHYAVDTWKKNEKTKTEAAANTSKDRFNIEWS